jgi:hypothetical protein
MGCTDNEDMGCTDNEDTGWMECVVLQKDDLFN